MSYYPQHAFTIWYKKVVLSEDYDDPTDGLFTPSDGIPSDLKPLDVGDCHCMAGYSFVTQDSDQGQYSTNTVYRGYAVWGSNCLPKGNIRTANLILQPFSSHHDGEVQQWTSQGTLGAVLLAENAWWKQPSNVAVLSDGPPKFLCDNITSTMMSGIFPPASKPAGKKCLPFDHVLIPHYTEFLKDGTAETVHLKAFTIDVTEHVVAWQESSKGNFGVVLIGKNENLFVQGSSSELYCNFFVSLEIEVHPGP
jgi:hypothetical protein